MITIKDVAKYANVSVSTVSRALTGNVNVDEKTKKNIMHWVKKLNYMPNRLAKSLKEGKTFTIAILIPDIHNPIFSSITQGVESKARKLGYTIMLCNTDEDPKIEAEYIKKLRSISVDGFIISTAQTGVNEYNYNGLIKENLPVVSLIRAFGYEKNRVSIDNFKASVDCMEFLIKRGHRKIAIVNGRQNILLYKDRFQGYLKILNKYNLSYNKNLVWSSIENGLEIGYKCVFENITKGNIPDAILATSDPIALHVIKAIQDCGLQVPDDISVISFDDIDTSELINPTLTCVSQPFYEMGAAAVEQLIALIESKNECEARVIEFPVNIVERRSVKEK